MILVRKSASPDIFGLEVVRDQVEIFNRELEETRFLRQKNIKFRFPVAHLKTLESLLLLESHGKCGYCEQELHGPGSMEIDHFRPISGAIDSEGERSDQHYYWLAYDWNNMLASCSECNRAKGSKFPVVSQRISVGIMSPDLDGYEHPMILNPSRYVPGKHLSFLPSGELKALSLEGEYTTKILKLNREDLVARRAKHVERLRAAIRVGDEARLLHDDAEFAGMSRELVVQFGGSSEIVHREETIVVNAQEPTALDSTNANSKDQSTYYSNFPLLKGIRIDGLFGLNELSFMIPTREDGSPGWLAILGENGVGKSSILRALALVLYDGDALQDLHRRPDQLLSVGVSEGSVTVHFDTGQQRTIRINNNGVIADENADTVPILLLGYGATRLSANDRHPFQPESEMARIANLFDPYVPLRDPSEWLASIEDPQFDYAAAAIKNLLGLGNDSSLTRAFENRNEILLRRYGVDQKLSSLSQGYQNVLTVACDIMAVLFSKWASIDAAQGTVLLDELENHLHPTWKMRIIANLRATFPRLQFILTTHDPLCLRGLSAGEVALLRRSTVPPYDAELIQNLPSIADLRVDQILTSSYFGLRTTVDPSVELLFDEYYDLLDREMDLQPDEQLRLGVLKVEVAKFDLPALLDRDRLMYMAIDRYLAGRAEPLPLRDVDFDTDLLDEIDRITDALAPEVVPKK